MKTFHTIEHARRRRRLLLYEATFGMVRCDLVSAVARQCYHRMTTSHFD